MPDDKQVCDCNGVCKGKIVDAIKAGKTTVAAVGKATRAGTGCGSCKKTHHGAHRSRRRRSQGRPRPRAYYVPAIPDGQAHAPHRDRKTRTQSGLAGHGRAGHQRLRKIQDGPGYPPPRHLGPRATSTNATAASSTTACTATSRRTAPSRSSPRIYGGVTTAEELIKIGIRRQEVDHVPTVKLTGGQRIDLLGIKKEDLPAVWADLGMVSGYAYTKAFRTCKTCVGSDWCRFGTNDSTALGIAIEKKFQGLETPGQSEDGRLRLPAQLRRSPPPRTSASSPPKAASGKSSSAAPAASRSAAATPSAASNRKTKLSVSLPRFMQYYQEHARYLERTYDFVPRIGIERLRAILIDDSEGLCAGLDARIAQVHQRHL